MAGRFQGLCQIERDDRIALGNQDQNGSPP